MKQISLISALTLMLAVSAEAAERQPAVKDDISWRANFKRVALEISGTEVSNAEQYKDSPSTQLNADSETVIKGVFDFALERETAASLWSNSLLMKYGKTTLRPAEGESTSSENSDQILLTTDYTHKIWTYEEADLGPFASGSYDTEFTDNEDAPRRKIFRGKSGIKLFNGQYTKELYIAAVVESDLTYAQANNKLAWEIGGIYEYPLRDGVKFQIEGYFRDYVTYSHYEGTDFKYDFQITSRMDVKLNDTLSLAPFVSYTRAHSREAKDAGSNFMIGLSLAYSDLFDL